MRQWIRALAIGSAVVVGLGAALGPAGVAGGTPAAGGDPLWLARFNAPSHGDDLGLAAAASPDGSKVFVTGASYSSENGNDYATFAYDSSSGSVIWSRLYSGPGTSYDVSVAIATSPDGARVYITGVSDDDYTTIAYDSTSGTPLWRRRLNGPGNGNDSPCCVTVSPDGSKVFVTGTSDHSTENEVATVAYDAVTGSVVWVRRYSRGFSDVAHGMAATDAAVFVTGYTFGSSRNTDYSTLAYEASTGTPLWAQHYNGPVNGDDEANGIAASPDGSRVFVTGFSGGDGTSFDYATFAYDAATGLLIWGQRYAGPGGADIACCVSVSPGGSLVFVTGKSYKSGTGPDATTLAYDSIAGAGLWKSRLEGPGTSTDSPHAMVATSDAVYVSGPSASDYMTFALSAAGGETRWARRYEGPGHNFDQPEGMALSLDGSKVFVTGWSDGLEGDEDFATIAYEA